MYATSRVHFFLYLKKIKNKEARNAFHASNYWCHGIATLEPGHIPPRCTPTWPPPDTSALSSSSTSSKISSTRGPPRGRIRGTSIRALERRRIVIGRSAMDCSRGGNVYENNNN